MLFVVELRRLLILIKDACNPHRDMLVICGFGIILIQDSSGASEFPVRKVATYHVSWLHITHYTLHNIITILLFIAKYRSSKIHSRREKRVVKGSEISEYIILPSSESHTSGVGVECFPRNTPSSLRSQFTNLHPASIYVAFAAEKCVPSFTVGKCFPPFSIQHDNISP